MPQYWCLLAGPGEVSVEFRKMVAVDERVSSEPTPTILETEDTSKTSCPVDFACVTPDSTVAKKRPGAAISAPAVKKPREELAAALRKQIEYYFSDNNMKYDRFFHSIITAEPEGWLEVKNILGCKKIQALGATQADILDALKDSELETKVDANEAAWVRRTAPLPPLETTPRKRQPGGKAGKKEKPAPKSSPVSPQDIHSLGCLIKISGVPEEISWTRVKQALAEALTKLIADQPQSTTEAQKEGSKKGDARRSPIRYVSPVDADGVCFVYCRKFANDYLIVQQITQLDISGSTLTVALCDDVQAAAEVFQNLLPDVVKKEREKDYTKLCVMRKRRPLLIGGTRFESVDHLRKCYRELLERTPAGQTLNPTAYKVIRALLDFHPNASTKAENVSSIKVDERKDLPTDITKSRKCFFLIRESGETEDFSIVKCIDNMMRLGGGVVDDEEKKSAGEPGGKEPASQEEQKEATGPVVEDTIATAADAEGIVAEA